MDKLTLPQQKFPLFIGSSKRGFKPYKVLWAVFHHNTQKAMWKKTHLLGRKPSEESPDNSFDDIVVLTDEGVRVYHEITTKYNLDSQEDVYYFIQTAKVNNLDMWF